mgnify:CR=1 FL=1
MAGADHAPLLAVRTRGASAADSGAKLIDVEILGHIFEQSISDIEELRAQTQGNVVPQVGKRKREGVVYTPDFITRFIVEQTIGAIKFGSNTAAIARRAQSISKVMAAASLTLLR